MKKVISLLIICLLLCGCSNTTTNFQNITLYEDIEVNYEDDVIVTPRLLLKSVDYSGKRGYVLCFRENMVMDEDYHMYSSNLGDSYISMDSYILDVEGILEQEIMDGLVEKAYERNTESLGSALVINTEHRNPYIISGNENCYYIDYLSCFNKTDNVVVYYHIQIKDIKDSDNLIDNLKELKEILNITDEYDYPLN